ncbi:D-TA family PLP-dependent enzyme [Jeotgalicoccus marinus]|uniref:D-TA family PLP-dependent enzyme n=1 Tax=Jeotgalicoccus marinus TaxID=516700 RepID=UPI00041AFC9E|nr:D-TA family PLP-dependent enzyme [Jeotgalicoccus marinus]
MNYQEIDTPALLIDEAVLEKNLAYMSDYAKKQNVSLRPHTKTHKMPKLAQKQLQNGASGITVAKIGEAEIMAVYGINDIFIANQVAGKQKLERIKKLAETVDISFGVDSIAHIKEIEAVFEGAQKKAQILIEIEVGEERSGIIEVNDYKALLHEIKASNNIELKGIFSHDGHTYKAVDQADCLDVFNTATTRTLYFNDIASEMGFELETVSIGSTPPFMFGFDIPEGVTEIRPGTYILMDCSQSNAIGTYEHSAASVLTTIISKPTKERVITDVGAKGLTAQSRSKGLTTTTGFGKVKEYDDVHVHGVFDEHAIIYNEHFNQAINIGDKVRIIPNHICPVSNLYHKAYLLREGEVVDTLDIAAQGKLQ